MFPRLTCLILAWTLCSYASWGLKLDAEHEFPDVNTSLLQQHSYESEKQFLHSVARISVSNKLSDSKCKQAPTIKGKGLAACRAANLLANSGSFGAASKIIAIASKAETCNRDYYDRGGGWARNCRSGWSKSGLMCYPSCPRGPGRWRRKADHCWQDCNVHGSGYGDTGFFCTKKSWGGWKRWLIKLQVQKKRAAYKPAKSLISHGSCRTVPHRPEDRAGLCYQNPRRHYKCTVTMCHIHCNNGETILNRECGLQCISGGGFKCFLHILNILVKITEAVVKTTLLALSLGTSASAAVATGGIRNTLKNVAKKKMKMLMSNVRNGMFKKWVKKYVKKFVKDKLKAELKHEFQYAVTNELMKLGGIGALQASDGAMSQMSRGKYRGAFERIDPTGLVKTIGATIDNKDNPTAIASAWLSLIATYDPTGWASVAVAFTKPACTWLTAKMKRDANEGKLQLKANSEGRKNINIIKSGASVAAAVAVPRRRRVKAAVPRRRRVVAARRRRFKSIISKWARRRRVVAARRRSIISKWARRRRVVAARRRRFKSIISKWARRRRVAVARRRRVAAARRRTRRRRGWR